MISSVWEDSSRAGHAKGWRTRGGGNPIVKFVVEFPKQLTDEQSSYVCNIYTTFVYYKWNRELLNETENYLENSQRSLQWNRNNCPDM